MLDGFRNCLIVGLLGACAKWCLPAAGRKVQSVVSVMRAPILSPSGFRDRTENKKPAGGAVYLGWVEISFATTAEGIFITGKAAKSSMAAS
jgi:hypothetical protein